MIEKGTRSPKDILHHGRSLTFHREQLWEWSSTPPTACDPEPILGHDFRVARVDISRVLLLDKIQERVEGKGYVSFVETSVVSPGKEGINMGKSFEGLTTSFEMGLIMGEAPDEKILARLKTYGSSKRILYEKNQTTSDHLLLLPPPSQRRDMHGPLPA